MAEKSRKEKADDLFKHHKDYFDSLGLTRDTDFVFIPKLFHFKKGEPEKGKVVGFFDSEFRSKLNIYTEKVSMDWESEDDNRTLYKFVFNPYYDEEYEKDGKRYLVSESEMVEVDKSDLIETVVSTSDDNDAPMAEMTLRDYAAIHMQKEISNKKWLNELIKSK